MRRGDMFARTGLSVCLSVMLQLSTTASNKSKVYFWYSRKPLTLQVKNKVIG